MKTVEIRFDLHPAQMTVFNDRTRFRVLAAGRRFGKTTLAIAEAVCAALNPDNKLKQPVFLIAPTQAQAKFLYWRPLLNKLGSLVTNTNVNEGLIFLNNGVVMGIKGADNPDALRGPGLFFAVLDEYGSMKSYVWTDIVRPMLVDSRGRALFIGTPPYERNHFFKLFMDGMEGEKRPDIKSFTFESKDNPFLPAGEIEEARTTMSTIAFNREFRGIFISPSAGQIKEEWIKYEETEPKGGVSFVTIDLAGFADILRPVTAKEKLLDEHAIVVTKVLPDGKEDASRWWVKSVQHGRWGIKETATKIVDCLLDAEPIAWGIEKGALYRAVLPGIMDEAHRRGKNLMLPTPLSHENRQKTERILWAIQGRMEHGKISFARGPWNRIMEDQMVQFPSNTVHDDIPDALSYVVQLSQGRVFEDYSELQGQSYWTPLDRTVGF
jgi:predicted phage terminase large subunit-like protein